MREPKTRREVHTNIHCAVISILIVTRHGRCTTFKSKTSRVRFGIARMRSPMLFGDRTFRAKLNLTNKLLLVVGDFVFFAGDSGTHSGFGYSCRYGFSYLRIETAWNDVVFAEFFRRNY